MGTLQFGNCWVSGEGSSTLYEYNIPFRLWFLVSPKSGLRPRPQRSAAAHPSPPCVYIPPRQCTCVLFGLSVTFFSTRKLLHLSGSSLRRALFPHIFTLRRSTRPSRRPGPSLQRTSALLFTHNLHYAALLLLLNALQLVASTAIEQAPTTLFGVTSLSVMLALQQLGREQDAVYGWAPRKVRGIGFTFVAGAGAGAGAGSGGSGSASASAGRSATASGLAEPEPMPERRLAGGTTRGGSLPPRNAGLRPDGSHPYSHRAGPPAPAHADKDASQPHQHQHQHRDARRLLQTTSSGAELSPISPLSPYVGAADAKAQVGLGAGAGAGERHDFPAGCGYARTHEYAHVHDYAHFDGQRQGQEPYPLPRTSTVNGDFRSFEGRTRPDPTTPLESAGAGTGDRLAAPLRQRYRGEGGKSLSDSREQWQRQGYGQAPGPSADSRGGDAAAWGGHTADMGFAFAQ